MSKKKRATIVLGAFALFALCALCGLIGAGLVSKSTALPTLVPTVAAATSTPAPTRTSAPTVVPTNTPTATPTVAPTATPAASLSPEEQAYLEAVDGITRAYATSLDELGRLSRQAGNDATLLFDDDWKLEVLRQMVVIKLAGQKLRGLEPPSRFARFHDETLAAAGHYDRGVELLATGIDELDMDAVFDAADEFELGGAATERAIELLPDLR